MSYIKSIITKVVYYFLRRRWLYVLIGTGAFFFLLAELATVDISKYYTIDFNKLEQDYGVLFTTIVAYFVSKIASGYDTITVVICLFLIISCLYIDLRVRTLKKGASSIWNLFFGVVQNINQDYSNKDGREE